MSESEFSFKQVGVLSCILGILSGVIAIVFAMGVSDITATTLQMGEGSAYSIGSLGMSFLNPLTWVVITAAVYGTYSKKGGAINNLAVLVGLVQTIIAAFASITYGVAYRATTFPLVFGIQGLTLGIALIVFGVAVLGGLEEAPSVIEKLTAGLFVLVGLLSIIGPFLMSTIKWPLYIMGIASVPFLLWLLVYAGVKLGKAK